MLHDDSSITMAARTYIADAEVIQQDQTEPVHINDDLDDVFGSAPGSPIFLDRDDHDDIHAGNWKLEGNAEVSDIPRLKEKHETEGYRDGVTKGKAESAQQGFDEGYSLGATLGLRIGKMLGLLEGIFHAVQSAAKDSANKEDEEWEVQSARMEKLLAGARVELKTQSVFGKDWWGEDGIWTFEVPGEGKGREVLFPDVAGAHPLVVKWEGLVRKEVEIWGLDLGVLDGGYDEKDAGKSKETKEEVLPSEALGAAKELAW